MATVSSSDPSFVKKADGEAALDGAARNQAIGHVPGASTKPSWRDVESERGNFHGNGPRPQPVKGDPLSAAAMGHAAHRRDADGLLRPRSGQPRRPRRDHGHRRRRQAPGHRAELRSLLSRNFTVDNSEPGIDDGPCEHPSCVDPNDEDDDGHGTHVASTIGSPLNGIGMAGVAPKVDIVNIRAGQDTGFFLLQPTVDALTYAGKVGIDVVNMSFYIDPWLFNCTSNPADSPEQQAQQRMIIEATTRAVNFAHRHGVTLIAAAGNESTDLGNPTFDDTSPDFPPDARMSARSTTAA